MNRFVRALLPLLGLFAALLPQSAAAYGVYGHETVARIGFQNAAPATQARVRQLLARAALLETPDCPARTIEQASVWPDCIRAMGLRFGYTAPWHYQNVDVCKPFDLKSACANGNCVSAQIERDVKLIQDRTVPEREKVAALAFLIHFVGDLHMPLHAGDRGDLGGNRLKASWGLWAPQWLNLHSVWDSPLAERALTTPPSIERLYAPAERAEIAAGSVEDWSREAWQVSHDISYASALGGDPCAPEPERVTLSDETIASLVAPARLQLLRAGLRLARMLDEAFDPARAFTPEPRRRN